jgi:hypothetical protein
MSFIQSTGQTSIHALQRVHDHVSTIYCVPFFKIALSGQIKLQLSQEIQSVLISRYGIISLMISKLANN